MQYATTPAARRPGLQARDASGHAIALSRVAGAGARGSSAENKIALDGEVGEEQQRFHQQFGGQRLDMKARVQQLDAGIRSRPLKHTNSRYFGRTEACRNLEAKTARRTME